MGCEWCGLMSMVSSHGGLGGDRMGKVRSLVPMKLTPSSRLDLVTNGFVLWKFIRGVSITVELFP